MSDLDDHTPEQREEVHADLLALKSQLETCLADAGGTTKTVELDQSTQGRLSRMDAMQRQEMAKAERRRAQVRLERVQAVLESYEDPEVDFGGCRDCGEPIPLPRLKALPDALFCVPCAQNRE